MELGEVWREALQCVGTACKIDLGLGSRVLTFRPLFF